VKVIHVLRKPLSEKTVAANVLVHGTGALSINASRIAFASAADADRHSQEWDREYNPEVNSSPIHTWDNAIGNHPGAKRTAGGGPRKTDGRWPPNLILEHDEGCRCIGTKRVKTSHINKPHAKLHVTDFGGVDAMGAHGYGSARADTTFQGLGDPDGMETVAAWDCAPGCPVAALDEQSLAGGMHGAGKARNKVVVGDVESTSINMGGARDMFRLGDAGGASRFYKQVGGTTRTDSE
jgi:hypothetical protein